MPRHHQRLRAMCRQLQPPSMASAAVEMTTYQKHQRYVDPAPEAPFYYESPESSTMYSAEETDAAVPRPALTPGERLHLEINGYVRLHLLPDLSESWQPHSRLRASAGAAGCCQRCVLEGGMRRDVQGHLRH